VIRIRRVERGQQRSGIQGQGHYHGSLAIGSAVTSAARRPSVERPTPTPGAAQRHGLLLHGLVEHGRQGDATSFGFGLERQESVGIGRHGCSRHDARCSS
jgi:hypothetical protein